MSFPIITPELIARIEGFHRRFSIARMEALSALESNPYQVEIAEFGAAVAFKSRSPLLRGKNRIQGFQEEDLPHLAEALDFFHKEDLRCTLSVPYGKLTQPLFRKLVEVGLWSSGSGTIPVIAPDPPSVEETEAASNDPAIRVREAGPEEKQLYLELFRRAFEERGEGRADYLAFQWAEDSLPGCRRYIAEVEGEPTAMASFPSFDGVGFFGTAGVAPEWRNRGVQMALLRHRLAVAPSLGIDLVIGGGRCFTTTHRNFERAGMRLIPMGSAWTYG